MIRVWRRRFWKPLGAITASSWTLPTSNSSAPSKIANFYFYDFCVCEMGQLEVKWVLEFSIFCVWCRIAESENQKVSLEVLEKLCNSIEQAIVAERLRLTSRQAALHSARIWFWILEPVRLSCKGCIHFQSACRRGFSVRLSQSVCPLPILPFPKCSPTTTTIPTWPESQRMSIFYIPW